jgi:hypothetical protein
VDKYGDQFFGTDAVIVDAEIGRLAVAHHEELAASLQGVPAVRWA